MLIEIALKCLKIVNERNAWNWKVIQRREQLEKELLELEQNIQFHLAISRLKRRYLLGYLVIRLNLFGADNKENSSEHFT